MAAPWPERVRAHGAHSAVESPLDRSQCSAVESNGELLNAADEAGFGLLLTSNRRIRYQDRIRMGLGARGAVTLVLGERLRVVAIGLPLGLAAAWRRGGFRTA